jgi:hypothetical protein
MVGAKEDLFLSREHHKDCPKIHPLLVNKKDLPKKFLLSADP